MELFISAENRSNWNGYTLAGPITQIGVPKICAEQALIRRLIQWTKFLKAEN